MCRGHRGRGAGSATGRGASGAAHAGGSCDCSRRGRQPAGRQVRREGAFLADRVLRPARVPAGVSRRRSAAPRWRARPRSATRRSLVRPCAAAACRARSGATSGPATVADSGNASGNISGRVSTLAVSPRCGLGGGCRIWVGTAGGGVWRSDDGMNTTDPKWKWIGLGLGTNSIGALAVDPNDRFGNTILVGTGETNTPNNSGAGTGLYRSTDGGDTWTRISTMIVDPVVQASAIDFTSTRGISTVVVEPGNSQVIYVATTTAMLGMTGVRGGQSQTTGYPQPRVRPVQDDRSRQDVVAALGAAAGSRDPGQPEPRRRHRRYDGRRPPREARSARIRASSTPPRGTTPFTGPRRRSRTATPRSSRSSRSWAAGAFTISRCST